VITGANSGLGKVTATELAGARVVLVVRSDRNGEQAAATIRQQAPSALRKVQTLDLSSLASVRAFATRLVGDTPVIDLLVNNAGIMRDHGDRPSTGSSCNWAPTTSGTSRSPAFCSRPSPEDETHGWPPSAPPSTNPGTSTSRT